MAKSVKYPVSPHCSRCPEIGPADYKIMLESMSQSGLIDKLSVLDNELLDGRARQRAADELGLVLTEDDYIHLKPGTEPRAFVVGKNLARRHLTNAQKAKMPLELCQDSTPGETAGACGPGIILQKNIVIPSWRSSPGLKPPSCTRHRSVP